MRIVHGTLTILLGMLAATGLFAQNSVKALLLDYTNNDPIPFATVSLTRTGATRAYKYNLSNDAGRVSIEGVRSGSYTFKAELMGYKTYMKEIKVEGDVDLGRIHMKQDREMLDAASVSAVGNAIIVKKDTIEYNANSFKTTDNDVLEDLLKKLPGVEVSENGSITVNGETISKITIDGKVFFLDDPQLASKNIPARIINKLKVVNKKSEQAEFTGIDDGEEETVIDLSIKPGMMKGAFGNVMAGGGHDIPADSGIDGDWRYQGAAFLGNFKKNSQISLILNGNNTNNRGFNDLSGSMMGNMRGGGMGGRGGGMGGGQGGWGGGNGITTSYMAGANGSWTLFDGNEDLNANYLFNRTDKDVEESNNKVTYVNDDYNLLYDSKGSSNTVSNGHRIGMRVDHKFSKNTSILFEPRVEFGNGSYYEENKYTTYADSITKNKQVLMNSGDSRETGDNRNFTTSGFALLRQRLGIPGRTLTVMGRYSFSNNELNAFNYSNTTISGEAPSLIDQDIRSDQHSSSIWGRATYTEPLGGNFYAEVNYRYGWSRSTSEKNTYDNTNGGQKDKTYSNDIINESTTQEIGANMMYQQDKVRFQLGFAAMPTRTYNRTTRYDTLLDDYTPKEYKDFRWKFSPRFMGWWEFSDNANGRVFYRGSTSQPSTRQLMPVPDNTNPLSVSFGNPKLKPYFSHNVRGDIRYNNKKRFSSFNIRFNGSYVQSPVVNLTWYNNGAAYSMPFNGPSQGEAGLSGFANIPIARSNFSISDFTRANWSKSSSYVGENINMATYTVGKDYYSFMDELVDNWNNRTWFNNHITKNTIESLSVTERLRLTYRSDNLELTASGRTRMSKSWYTIRNSKTTTWNNQIRLGINWTWEATGITFKSDADYNWYNGYSTYQPDEYVIDAEIQKLLFRRKVTLAIKGYDILGQAKNLSVTDNANYHTEVVNNTLGRYIIASLTWRFGTFDRNRMRGPGGRGGMGGPGMGGPGGMGGRGMGGPR